jgi:hypothetical protein
LVNLSSLWLPILLAALAVFVASSVIHMVLSFWHGSDFKKIPNEDAVLDAIRPFGLQSGEYIAPRPGGMEDLKSAAYRDKAARGPNLMMNVLPNGDFSMGRKLAAWFFYCVVVGVFSGYVGGATLAPQASYLAVFRVTGTVAFCSYSLALWHASIWYNRSVRTVLKSNIDGLVYALLTAGVFGWLWPRA